MAGLLYYFPALKSLTPEQLAGDGLLDILGPHGFNSREVDAGPDGAPGLVGSAPADAEGATPATLGYWPDSQTWEQAGGRSYWVGRAAAGPVRPLDLLRARPIDGHAVELADGQRWLVPTALDWEGNTRLPRTLKPGADGQLIGQVVPAWRPTLEQALRVREMFLAEAAGEAVEMTTGEAYALACNLLRINYRIGPAEVGVLGLLTDQNLGEVLRAFIDIPGLLAVQAAHEAAGKKKRSASTPDGCDTCCGGGA